MVIAIMVLTGQVGGAGALDNFEMARTRLNSQQQPL